MTPLASSVNDREFRALGSNRGEVGRFLLRNEAVGKLHWRRSSILR